MPAHTTKEISLHWKGVGSHAGCMGRRWRHCSRPLYRLATDPGLCALHQRQVQEGLDACELLGPKFWC
ncbi:hypothetical protein PHYPO_G00121940 [Pangasianodon hypophthalmus]|uniref:Uncharacterized protein n=1 Tax=Pangasianodon hypophthalmus TaxID=310915 RepID=A0A5N5KZ69_PANHP|nr:hypothetical protein PHYPO_G00121940 [Pangasianodon hypophthalmus]